MLQGENQLGMDLKTKPQAATIIILWFLGVLALILAVIGDKTVNIPEIFEMFMFFEFVKIIVRFETL